MYLAACTPLALLALCGKCSGRGRHKPKLGAGALVREIGENKYVDSLEGREDADLLLGGVGTVHDAQSPSCSWKRGVRDRGRATSPGGILVRSAQISYLPHVA